MRREMHPIFGADGFNWFPEPHLSNTPSTHCGENAEYGHHLDRHTRYEPTG